jgi:hypothetical protein
MIVCTSAEPECTSVPRDVRSPRVPGEALHAAEVADPVVAVLRKKPLWQWRQKSAYRLVLIVIRVARPSFAVRYVFSPPNSPIRHPSPGHTPCDAPSTTGGFLPPRRFIHSQI